MNRVELIGRLTKDAELRYTPNNIATCTFTIAVNRAHTNQDGERETDFIPVVVWKKLAENTSKYVKKGSLVAICGRIQTRSYTVQDNTKRYVTEVIADSVQFLDSKGSNHSSADNITQTQSSAEESQQEEDPFLNEMSYAGVTINESDLPF